MITLTILTGDQLTILRVPRGANLRRVLLENGFSPYTRVTSRANCGGRGICATCGVWVEQNAPPPVHWHDKLADGFGYPRLSCQITLDDDLTLRLVDDKWLWGSRDPQRARWFAERSGGS